MKTAIFAICFMCLAAGCEAGMLGNDYRPDYKYTMESYQYIEFTPVSDPGKWCITKNSWEAGITCFDKLNAEEIRRKIKEGEK